MIQHVVAILASGAKEPSVTAMHVPLLSDVAILLPRCRNKAVGHKGFLYPRGCCAPYGCVISQGTVSIRYRRHGTMRVHAVIVGLFNRCASCVCQKVSDVLRDHVARCVSESLTDYQMDVGCVSSNFV